MSSTRWNIFSACLAAILLFLATRDHAAITALYETILGLTSNSVIIPSTASAFSASPLLDQPSMTAVKLIALGRKGDAPRVGYLSWSCIIRRRSSSAIWPPIGLGSLAQALMAEEMRIELGARMLVSFEGLELPLPLLSHIDMYSFNKL